LSGDRGLAFGQFLDQRLVVLEVPLILAAVRADLADNLCHLMLTLSAAGSLPTADWHLTCKDPTSIMPDLELILQFHAPALTGSSFDER
jgi:hypothetical protein